MTVIINPSNSIFRVSIGYIQFKLIIIMGYICLHREATPINLNELDRLFHKFKGSCLGYVSVYTPNKKKKENDFDIDN